jgi:hypothetical protein
MSRKIRKERKNRGRTKRESVSPYFHSPFGPFSSFVAFEVINDLAFGKVLENSEGQRLRKRQLTNDSSQLKPKWNRNEMNGKEAKSAIYLRPVTDLKGGTDERWTKGGEQEEEETK